jgi:hypothetical protein
MEYIINKYKKMKRLLFLTGLLFIVLSATCQKDKIFDVLVTFKQGIKFNDGTIQLTAATGTGIVTWNAISNKPTTLVGYGITDAAILTHNHTGTYEQYLANPTVSGYVLTSTTSGTRSWIALPSGGNMIYPSGSGIPIITSGTSWGTTITNNSSNWNTAFSWGNHSGLYRPITWVPTFAQVTSKPTTLSGYGITDAKPLSYVPTWNDITSKPMFAIVATTGSYNDLFNKPLTEELDVAIKAYNGDIFSVLTQTQINALPLKKGLVVINSTENVMQWCDGIVWKVFITNQ